MAGLRTCGAVRLGTSRLIPTKNETPPPPALGEDEVMNVASDPCRSAAQCCGGVILVSPGKGRSVGRQKVYHECGRRNSHSQRHQCFKPTATQIALPAIATKATIALIGLFSTMRRHFLRC